MVYSTCTFNPVENEAVVAEVLRRSKVCFQVLCFFMQLFCSFLRGGVSQAARERCGMVYVHGRLTHSYADGCRASLRLYGFSDLITASVCL
jgi:hypothetical protein